MHICEFCNTFYTPRPQVKRPRACKNCQQKRQKANEKAWRERNRGLYDRKYHAVLRERRCQTIQCIISMFMKVIKIGSTFIGQEINTDQIEQYFSELFRSLGIRKLKKVVGNIGTT